MSQLLNQTVNMYKDGAIATITYQQRGWGPFVSYEVEVEYMEADEYDNNLTTTTTAAFKVYDDAEAWAYDTVLEHRLNG